MLTCKIHILHICSLFYITIIFLYCIYIMATRYKRRNLKRTVKNKKRKSYRKRGGSHEMNVQHGQRILDYNTSVVKYGQN